MSTIWSRTDGANGPSLSIIFSNGEVALIGKEHVNLAAITVKLAEGIEEDALRELISPAKNIAARFQRLSERITTDGANILLDGDVINDGLTDYILELIRLENEGEASLSWKPFVNFLEKLSQNPSASSKSSLYAFIQKHGLTIRNDGDFIAYKGLTAKHTSLHSGPGIVNNIKMNGQLPNLPGNIVEIARSLVVEDQQRGCTVGLHAGTLHYASTYGTELVAVAINPRDVVSVPLDSNFQKLRVCRYEVITDVPRPARESTPAARQAPLWNGPQRFAPAKPAVDPKLLKKLEKAVKNGTELVVSYKPLHSRTAKTYSVKPTRIDGDLLHLNLTGYEGGNRTFIITQIESAKKVDDGKSKKGSKKAKTSDPRVTVVPNKVAPSFGRGPLIITNVAESEAVRTVKTAIKEGKLVTVKYATANHSVKTYLVKPLSIVDGKLRLQLPSENNARRDFSLKNIVGAEAHRESKKNKGSKKK